MYKKTIDRNTWYIKLYNKGYYLGIISNNSIDNVNYILEKENLSKYFKKVIISEEIGERKPNLKVYLKAFEDIPQEEFSNITFVSDEVLEDLAGTMILEIKTVWLQNLTESKWRKKEDVAVIKPDYTIGKIEDLIDLLRLSKQP